MGLFSFLPTILSGAGAIFSATRKKPSSQLEDFKLPYYEDPDYRKAQDYLAKLGPDILGGNIPDYYKALGETGSNEFENYLRMLEGDVSRNVMEGAAAIGRGRGGLVPAQISEQVGKLSTEARYNDYLRAFTSKQWLFGQGKDITENVRSAGLDEGTRGNTFALNRSRLELDVRGGLDEFEKYKEGWEAQKGQNIAEGSDHPFEVLSTTQAQNAGFSRTDGRPLSNPVDPHPGSCPNWSHAGAGIGCE